MHGRLKVKSTAEQEAEKQKERQKKLLLYTGGCKKVAAKRNEHELDTEALSISGQLLQGNPDHYTFWNFRKEIIIFMRSNRDGEDDFLQELLESELQLTESCLRKNHKSYGAWHHRAWVLKAMPKPNWKKEIYICGKSLQLDERNFHGWNHRHTVCKLAEVNLEEELSFTLEKLESNFSNYSAWHYRSSILPLVHPGKNVMGPQIEQETLFNEFELVKNAAFTDPNDQSAWFYHRWLIGRVETTLRLLCCYLNQNVNQIVVVFSKPIKQQEIHKLGLLVNKEIKSCDWRCPANSPFASSVWFCDIPWYSALDPTEIVVIFEDCEDKDYLKLSDKKCDLVWNNNARDSLYNLDVGGPTTEILQKELESCLQLLDLEPDNKWALLTCVSLFQTVDWKLHKEQVISYLDKLVDVDSTRRNYYKDLRSKFIIENFLTTFLIGTDRTLNMSGKNLTLFCHSDHLVYLRHLDLSNNQISNLTSLRCLISLERLLLDHNIIENCSGLESMSHLQSLSLNNNSINCIAKLFSFKSCKKLEHLSIQHNPISGISDCREQITLHFPSLKCDI